jgi:hypothetical protein
MANGEQIDKGGGAPPGSNVPRGVYNLCYYLAFGAVYASHLAMELVPADSIVRHGLRDGAESARNAWARPREEHDAAEREMALPEEAVDAPGKT